MQEKKEIEIHPKILEIKDLIFDDINENGFSDDEILEGYKEDEDITEIPGWDQQILLLIKEIKKA